MNLELWLAVAFLCGAMPFSVWVGNVLLKADIRQYGDGNPGATNVLRAGGRQAALLALVLDYAKGAVPVGLAHFSTGLSGWQLALVAVMPVLGHAFSPFLRGHGGKAVAVTFGIWSGLTLWEGPMATGLFMIAGVLLFGFNAWAVLLAMLGLLVYMFSSDQLFLNPARPDLPVLIGVWLLNLAVIAWKHRSELAAVPRLRGRGEPFS